MFKDAAFDSFAGIYVVPSCIPFQWKCSDGQQPCGTGNPSVHSWLEKLGQHVFHPRRTGKCHPLQPSRNSKSEQPEGL